MRGHPSSPPGGKAPKPQEIQQLVALSDAGRLVEAEKLARQLTRRYPAHGFGWQALGTLCIQLGQSPAALPALERAVALLPRDPRAYCNLALALASHGRLEEAEAHFRRSLILDASVHETHNNYGNLLSRQGRILEAEQCFRRAVACKPDYARGLANLGIALYAMGRQEEAETALRQSLVIDPALSEALNPLCGILAARGAHWEAFEMVWRSLQQAETPVNKTLFVTCAKRLRFRGISPELRMALVRALSEPWGIAQELSPAVAHVLKTTRGIGPAIERASTAWPGRLSGQELFGGDGFFVTAGDPLVQSLLTSAPVADRELERYLTLARHVLLDLAVQAHDLDAAMAQRAAVLAGLLAQQCFINEYVFAVSVAEAERVAALKTNLAQAVALGGELPPLRLLVLACYQPLLALPGIERLLALDVPEYLADVLRQQVREPLVEQQLQAAMPRLTVIGDGVSQAVRGMYEDNPYPRWVRCPPAPYAIDVDQFIQVAFPLAAALPLGKANEEIDLLIAGCGTGKHAMEVAGRFPGVRILAVDLSLASLGYAQRKTQEAGIAGIEYAQADILKLGALNKKFDVIESSGVLHHLADPWAGWRVLLSLLRPGGLMKLGFYSETARRGIVAARALIAQRGYGSTPEAIRDCRQELVALEASEHLGMAVNSGDFYSTSGCRDLLFHVQEHRLTLPQIGEFLAAHGLRFLGFVLDNSVMSLYRLRFPDDPAANSLGNWHVFEEENPDTFIQMYQFWVQKTGERVP